MLGMNTVPLLSLSEALSVEESAILEVGIEGGFGDDFVFGFVDFGADFNVRFVTVFPRFGLQTIRSLRPVSPTKSIHSPT